MGRGAGRPATAMAIDERGSTATRGVEFSVRDECSAALRFYPLKLTVGLV